MKDKADQYCEHPTCKQSIEDPEFDYFTKSAMFKQRSDFNKVLVFKISEDPSLYLQPRNPHHRNSGNWISFEQFRSDCTFRIAGPWPSGNIFLKSDIGFEYFLFARRIRGAYDPLTDKYASEIVIDVEKAAVYLGEIK